MFEFSVAFAFSIVGGYLFLQRRYPIRSIGFIPIGVALAMLLYASSLPSEIKPLVPALQNAPLLTIHVGMAVTAYGIFATSFAAGVAYLIQGQDDRFAWLPSHKVLDEVAYRAVIIGFPIFATMIILGSWWASIAWSRYWGWDPKETAALVTWLTYAVYLHARNQRSWAGRPAALLLVVGFGMVLVTYSGLALVQRPARLQRPLGRADRAPDGPGEQHDPDRHQQRDDQPARETIDRRAPTLAVAAAAGDAPSSAAWAESAGGAFAGTSVVVAAAGAGESTGASDADPGSTAAGSPSGAAGAGAAAAGAAATTRIVPCISGGSRTGTRTSPRSRMSP